MVSRPPTEYRVLMAILRVPYRRLRQLVFVAGKGAVDGFVKGLTVLFVLLNGAQNHLKDRVISCIFVAQLWTEKHPWCNV